MPEEKSIVVGGKTVYLSCSQLETLEHIERYMLENHMPPTVRILCDLCGVKSTATMHDRLVALEDKGVIRKFRDTPRGITSVRIEYGRVV